MTEGSYQSKDLMFSAAVLAEGIPLINAVTNSEDGYLTFVFDDFERCSDLERKWWSGSLTVNATRYAEAIKRLKNLVYSEMEKR